MSVSHEGASLNEAKVSHDHFNGFISREAQLIVRRT